MTLEDIITIGIDRNILVYDADAPPGTMTKRLLSLSSAIMRRNSKNRKGKITDIFLSAEGFEDLNSEKNKGYINRFNYHVIDRLGCNSELMDYFKNTCQACLAHNDLEFGIALDLNGSFEIFLNGQLHTEQILLFSY